MEPGSWTTSRSSWPTSRRPTTTSPRGIEVSDIDDLPWGSFVHFADPDGNRWAVQQTVPRTAS